MSSSTAATGAEAATATRTAIDPAGGVVVPNPDTFFTAIAVITFIASWNAFLWPLLIGQHSSAWTVQVALCTALTAQTIDLHELFLAAAVPLAPLVLVFAFLQRYLVQGVPEAGIKG
jgi:multiple sugar transport system permease protein